MKPIFKSWSTIGEHSNHYINRKTGVQYQAESYQRLKKMEVETSLLKTRYSNVQIKCKVEQYSVRSNSPLNKSV